jgi:hypothetical protein
LVATHGQHEGDDLKKKVTDAIDEKPQTYGTWGH